MLLEPSLDAVKGFVDVRFRAAKRKPNMAFTGGAEGRPRDGDHPRLVEQTEGDRHGIDGGGEIACHEIISPLRCHVIESP